jgi:hypothetical protein
MFGELNKEEVEKNNEEVEAKSKLTYVKSTLGHVLDMTGSVLIVCGLAGIFIIGISFLINYLGVGTAGTIFLLIGLGGIATLFGKKLATEPFLS